MFQTCFHIYSAVRIEYHIHIEYHVQIEYHKIITQCYSCLRFSKKNVMVRQIVWSGEGTKSSALHLESERPYKYN